MSDINMTAAFKTNVKNEAYIFMKNEFVIANYAPGDTDDKILYGPDRLSRFPSLRNTIFSNGIDCAFGSHDPGEAYIFAWNNCAKWVYPSKSTSDKIIEGPMPIERMFPFLKDTVFADGVDAAYESCVEHRAYLFKGNKYALITYGGPESPRLIHIQPLLRYWAIFKGTIFENGNFDAALASHLENEVYFFKGDSYVRVRYTLHVNKELLIGGVMKMKAHWHSLGSILPRKSCQNC